MTLRMEDGKPVGLDWSVCTDGQQRPEVWRQERVAKAAKSPKEDDGDRPERASTKRLLPGVEREVIRLYRDEGLSALKVGAELSIQPATVFKVLKRNGVETRSRSEAMALSQATRG